MILTLQHTNGLRLVRAAGFVSSRSLKTGSQRLPLCRMNWNKVMVPVNNVNTQHTKNTHIAKGRCYSTMLFQSRGGAGFSDDENDDLFTNPNTNGMPVPPSSDSSRPNKGDVYSNDELMELFQLHQEISDQVSKQDEETPASPEQEVLSLHDLVMQAVQEVDATKDSSDNSKQQQPSSQDLQQKVKDIIAIASDVDGTLLSSKHTLHPRTEHAIRRAVAQISTTTTTTKTDNLQYFFPATGKSRKGALDSLGPEIRALLEQLPGVFIQGLYCVDGNGNVVFEQKLSSRAIERAEALAADLNITVLGYDGDYLYCNSAGDPIQVTEIHEKWGEPMPKSIDSLQQHPHGFHKLLFTHHNVPMLTTKMRPALEVLAQDNQATVTTAVPTMLELLPEGCSKADGVNKLCETLGIEPSKQLLAIGDAENDVGMLQLAAIGVAVNNACDLAKGAADVVMEESNDDGGAGAAMEQYSNLKI